MPLTQTPLGIIFIDKPSGITSFGVVRELRARLGIKKIGHAGTLDPAATGLLLVGVGAGTKLLKDLLKLPKEYRAELCLGTQTETGDREGKVIASASARGIPETRIREAIEGLVGTLELPVPAYSAVKVSGVRLYKSARQGKCVALPIKPMTVLRAVYHDMRIEGDEVLVRVTFEVASGTYIRSLAEEVGRRLGVPATLHSLRRTRIGSYDISQAVSLADVRP